MEKLKTQEIVDTVAERYMIAYHNNLISKKPVVISYYLPPLVDNLSSDELASFKEDITTKLTQQIPSARVDSLEISHTSYMGSLCISPILTVKFIKKQ